MGKKLARHEVASIVREVERGERYSGDHVRELPATPGRDTVERGLSTVREGLAQIKKEAEL